MKNIKMIVWAAGIFLVVLVVVILAMVFGKPDVPRISRASAFRAAALAVTSESECERLEAERTAPYFQARDQQQWYVKYMGFLYDRGYLIPDETPADSKTAEGWLTYGDVERLAGHVSPSLSLDEPISRKKMDEPMPAEEWWLFYDRLLGVTDTGNAVTESQITLYGTPLNVPDAPVWTAYTDKGEYLFEGLGMDSYIDSRILVLVRDNAIIRVKEMVTDSIVYENVWLSQGKGDRFLVHVGGVEREFERKASLGSADSLLNNVADIYLENGKLKKVVLKKERITGKVLSVKENSIEIEGYGTVVLDPGFRVFKVYGEFEEQRMSDILVGYDIQEFVVAGGKICAALTVREFDAKSIRVLLMDNGFDSIFHTSVTLSAPVRMTMLYEESETVIEPGEKITITPDDERFSDGRIVFKLSSVQDEITVHSIKRALGQPSYGGTFEIKKEKEGLVIINEIYLEDYLTKVVPSEMPSSYEMEALKAQAVCARTYAYKQIQGNTYSQYGAHVDDSTRFQVYNNIKTDSKTQSAVSETYGKMLMLDERPVEAYYFSTSCGHTTDGTIWGAAASSVPYLEGVLLKDEGRPLNLTNNDDFSAFIKDKNYITYETGFPFYRWETTITNRQLEEKITGIGSILNITMTERGVGGIGKSLRVEGSEGNKAIRGQGEIRSILGNKALTITKNDGGNVTGWSTIPSAFIAIEKVEIDENNTITFHIYGGGYGHGVGMSQNGAQGMAKAGMTYEEILEFFFSDVEVRSIQ